MLAEAVFLQSLLRSCFTQESKSSLSSVLPKPGRNGIWGGRHSRVSTASGRRPSHNLQQCSNASTCSSATIPDPDTSPRRWERLRFPLFGPTSPMVWRPLGPNAAVIASDNRNIASIQVAAVVRTVLGKLERMKCMAGSEEIGRACTRR